MDDTDRRLLLLMGADPRMRFQEIAKKLGISRQAVHNRVQTLTKLGVIRGMHAGVSVSYLGAVSVVVFGRSRTSSIEETLDTLSESESTRRAVIAGGNYLYVVGFLRDLSELGGFSEFVRRAGDMTEPIVGIYSHDDALMPHYYVDGGGKRGQPYSKLSPLDLKIVASLRDDARRPAAEVADMLGVSAKTVRRHIERMMSEGSLEMHMPADLSLGGDLMLLMHVNLRAGADAVEVGKRLLSKYLPQDAYVRRYSNLPGFLLVIFWSDKMEEIRKVLREVDGDEDVLAAMLNFGYLERIYPTWRDRLPEVDARPLEAARTRDRPSRSRRR